MSKLNIDSELFVELSNEQEEVVSGGINLVDLINTSFSSRKQSLIFGTNAQSGPNGSSVSQLLMAENTEIDTSASKSFTLSFDPSDSLVL
jgi:hypothetical protein